MTQAAIYYPRIIRAYTAGQYQGDGVLPVPASKISIDYGFAIWPDDGKTDEYGNPLWTIAYTTEGDSETKTSESWIVVFKGEWIIVNDSGEIEVLTDTEFHRQYEAAAMPEGDPA